ncbi:putative zinc finger in N-recognin-domain-containing protein [Cladorrhinum sp. PSN259]|nr:putative zinc finger in N-recognin-domain-containing protein [Cladorrhinum sp. PSN259]
MVSPALEDAPIAPTKKRSDSMGSHQSSDSQTAADFIRDQMQLEADAREALPYSIENCTKPLGSLRQAVFACLTCLPPPENPSDPYDAAGVCYSCSVQCHGDHTLVEIFNKRNFTCDCGTTRFPATSPCNLRINPETNTKGGVHSEEPDVNNKYNQNFQNRFCGCSCLYDPFQQEGTMFQCLGLGTHETGGCGEDWWHPGCVVGLGPKWFEKMEKKEKKDAIKPETTDGANGGLATISEDAEGTTLNGEAKAEVEQEDDDDDGLPLPPGFPAEDEFEGFICYKCIEAHPWIKRYAGTEGFLPPVYFKPDSTIEEVTPTPCKENPTIKAEEPPAEKLLIVTANNGSFSKKRKADDDDTSSQTSKRPKNADSPIPSTELSSTQAQCKAPPPLSISSKQPFSLFFTSNFRSKLCHCPSCFPLLTPHPQLLEEEETYEPPVSEDGSQHGGSTQGSGSLYERGESALRNVDRVRAIEGVMAYNHLKDKLKPFFQEFAESGKAISAEDIKGYFAKLRGDEEVVRVQGGGGDQVKDGEGGGEGGGASEGRKEQSGY